MPFFFINIKFQLYKTNYQNSLPEQMKCYFAKPLSLPGFRTMKRGFFYYLITHIKN